MHSQSKMGTKRSSNKTYAAFNALPSLRNKDPKKSEKSSPERKFHRPPVFADQMLFPGRRLDRIQPSLLSGYSGRSLDIETIVSGGRPDTSSLVDGGSAKVSGNGGGQGALATAVNGSAGIARPSCGSRGASGVSGSGNRGVSGNTNRGASGRSSRVPQAGNVGGEGVHVPAPGLLGSKNFTRSLNDISSGGWTGGLAWDAIRQPVLSSAQSRHSRQQSRGASQERTLVSREASGGGRLRSRSGSRPGGEVRSNAGMLGGTYPGASVSMGNLTNDGTGLNTMHNTGQGCVPVSLSRWQSIGPQATAIRRTEHAGSKSKGDTLSRELPDSPDSSYSSESVSDNCSQRSPQLPVPAPAEPVPKIHLNRQDSNPHSSDSETPQDNDINKNTNYAQQSRPKYLRRTSRRHSETSISSPTPQLDKILWALVPDEFANISDTGVSDMGPNSSHQDSASSRFMTFTDVEAAEAQGRTGRVPDTPRRPTLTEETLKSQTSLQAVPNDDRIMQWLADCDEKITTTGLPTHLPDISYTFKHAKH